MHDINEYHVHFGAVRSPAKAFGFPKAEEVFIKELKLKKSQKSKEIAM